MNYITLAFLAPLRHRAIFRQFLRREILGRYRGSMLGIAWAFITPLLMLGVYTLVFVGIFKARWPGVEESGGMAFALRLFTGLMVFNMFAEVTGRASSLITEQPNLVKKVAFPLELLAFVSLGSSLFHFFVSTVILFLGCLATNQELPATITLLPIVIIPLVFILLGVSWILSALGVFVRDMTTVVGLGVSLLMFLSPVFYSVSTLEQRWQFWMQLNPLTSVIENVRAVVFLGKFPDWSAWGITLLIGLGVACIGAWAFGAMRDGFSDVL